MTAAVSSHPQPKLLKQYGLGQLDSKESSVVESHVSTCAECAAALQQVPDDTLMHLLRGQDTQTQEPSSAAPAAPLAAGSPAVAEAETLSLAAAAAPPGADVSAILSAFQDHPRYRILRRLGHGGMGDVYLAEHLRMGRRVALKVIKPELVNQQNLLKRFHQEVKAVARLAHPNIVQAHDADQAGPWHFLIMEYIEGACLGDHLKAHGPLPAAEACDYLRQAALGLQHAYEHGLTHRDVKPHNLMRTPSGQLKILDFGLALLADKLAEDSSNDTRTGTAMGTADYMSPEQAEDAHRVDIRSDIYSLGCTLYHLLAGHTPFPQGSALQKMVSHVAEMPTSLSQIRPDISVELVAVVEKMMAKKPADRYQTPAQVARALAPFVEQMPLATSENFVQPAVRKNDITLAEVAPAAGALPKAIPVIRPRKRRPRLVALIAVAGCVVLGLGIAAGVVVLNISTDRGVIQVKTSDPDIELTVSKSGEILAIYDGNTNQKWLVDTKKLTLGMADQPGGLKIELDGKRPLILKRDGKDVVTITWVLPKEIVQGFGPELPKTIGFIRSVPAISPHLEGNGNPPFFSKDGRLFAVPVSNRHIPASYRIYETVNGRLLEQVSGYDIPSAIFLPSGKQFLTARVVAFNTHYEFLVRDLETHKDHVLDKIENPAGWPSRLNVSADGNRLAFVFDRVRSL